MYVEKELKTIPVKKDITVAEFISLLSEFEGSLVISDPPAYIRHGVWTSELKEEPNKKEVIDFV